MNHNLDSLSIDSILRNSNNERVLYTSELLNENSIKYITPNNNVNLINTICVYTNKLSKTFFINENDINWEIINNQQAIKINHNLNAEVNIILRDNDNKLMFKYSDYILNENQILIIFPNDSDIVKSFTVDIYPIFKL